MVRMIGSMPRWPQIVSSAANIWQIFFLFSLAFGKHRQSASREWPFRYAYVCRWSRYVWCYLRLYVGLNCYPFKKSHLTNTSSEIDAMGFFSRSIDTLLRVGTMLLPPQLSPPICPAIKTLLSNHPWYRANHVAPRERDVLFVSVVWFLIFLSTKVGRGFEDLSRLTSYIGVSPLSCD